MIKEGSENLTLIGHAEDKRSWGETSGNLDNELG